MDSRYYYYYIIIEDIILVLNSTIIRYTRVDENLYRVINF